MTQTTPSSTLSIALEADPTVHFALQQNDVPLVKLLRLRNDAATDCRDVEVRLTLGGEIAEPWLRRIDRIPAGATHNFEIVDLRLDGAALRRRTEREKVELLATVAVAGVEVARTSVPTEVLAFQEWPGLASLPALTACFVLPNHPAIDGLLARAATRLRAATGNGAIDGYAAKDPTRVAAIVRAGFEAVADCGIAYANPPASFETSGQRVRLPDQILAARVATCLDLTFLLAAVLEQAGLRPLVVLTEGHAFAGAWTVAESFQEVTGEDGLRLRKRVDVGDVIVVEATATTVDGACDFDRAVADARRHLNDLAAFRAFVDVAAARRARFLPLPVLAAVGEDAQPPDAVRGDAPAVATTAPVPGVPTVPVAPVPTDAVRAPEPPAGRLERWKRRLLDLGLRNRLINFRETRTTLRLVAPDLGALEDAFADGRAFTIEARAVTPPAGTVRDEQLHYARTGEDLQRAMVVERLGAGRLVADHTEEETGRRQLEVWRHARTAIEESGANTLYLALGMLTWFEAPASSIARKAPILLLPLAIERVSALEGFRVRLADDDPRINVTLLEKLKAEFPVDVRGLDELVEDAQGLDVPEILRRVRKAILHLDRWDVVDEAWIAPFSFTKFLMWLDLQERADRLLESPVLRHLVERPGAVYEPESPMPDADELDETLPVADVLCPLDADSSQLAAVRAAHDGRSFVLEGPPGTGKSQTITNLIAQCLAHGKRVLFVSEKMAALDVVHRRLEAVGLGPFCLELHSSKASKRQVLDQMVRAFEAAAPREPADWEQRAERLEASRRELNRYVDTIHRPRGFGESVFRATSLLCGKRDVPRVELAAAGMQDIDAAWVAERRDAVDRLATAGATVGFPGAHPLRALRRAEWEATLGDRFDRECRTAVGALDELDAAAGAIVTVVGGEVADWSRAAFGDLVAAVRLVIETPGPGVRALTEPGWDDLRARMLGFIEDVRQKDELRTHVRVAFTDAVLGADLDSALADLRTAIGSVWPWSWWRARKVRRALAAYAPGGALGRNEELAGHLEQAIDLRERVRAFADPGHPAQAWFGAGNWRGGDPGGAGGLARLAATIEWVGRLRQVLARLPDDPAAAPVRDRLVALASDDRDALEPGARVGEALRRLDVAVDAFDAARDRLADLMDVDDEVAWTPAEPGAPWLAHARATLDGWLAAHRMSLDDWCHWRRTRSAAVALRLDAIVAAFELDDVAARALPDVFERAFREAWLNAVTDADEVLRTFHGREHERRIRRFAELDEELIRTAREVVAARLAARVPRASDRAADTSEVGIVLREARKKTRHAPVRRLFAQIPNLLPRLKPCFLMSPLSVAQYLAPDLPAFDLVVFDEASQITPWDAVGAIARGRACIVVGDTRQLPPTTFFQRADAEDWHADELDFEELESILDESAAAGLRAMRLRWHYRSRHESLIAFSNWHYYDNRLLTFPGPEAESRELGVSFVAVDGVYDRARSRTNRREAESVVADVVGRLREAGDPAQAPSIGIVTFSQAQQQLVEDLLDAARRREPAIEPFFTDAVDEQVFVKNLENVQGDERDVILFSIGYGPDEAGKVAMNFGPLNVAGGERRLNVAITRARRQVVVHATLRPEHIDLTRTHAQGVKHLKTFLDYAMRGPAAIAEACELDGAAAVESPFEQQVRDALVARGHDVVLQVGCSGYRIDLAVRDPERPGRFLLGIECDGAFYHSARTARDRDRLREGVLRRLGWQLCRVWSTDWWRSPEKELDRIERALIEARRAAPPAEPPRPVRVPEAEVAPVERVLMSASAEPGGALPPGASRYAPLVVEPQGSGDAIHEAGATPVIRELAQRVLDQEAPILGDLLCRRVASAWTDLRVTSRVRARVLGIVAELLGDGVAVDAGTFLWPVTIDRDGWRGFRVVDAADPASQRAADEIPPEECANAAQAVLAQQVALPRADLLRETARLLGFSRTGSRVEAAVDAGIELLLERGRARDDGGKIAAAISI